MVIKKCKKCGKEKILDEFYKDKKTPDGHQGSCKECIKFRSALWKLNHAEHCRKRDKEYRKNNLERLKTQRHDYHVKNKEKENNNARRWREANVERSKELGKRWRFENKELCNIKKYKWISDNIKKFKSYVHKSGIKRRSTLKGNLSRKMSVAIGLSLRKHNTSKKGHSWENLVGYTTEQLKNHLVSQFKEGMTEELLMNGKIHIDHIIPISAFHYQSPNDIGFRLCWALDNLQPLWATENLKKKDKVKWEEIYTKYGNMDIKNFISKDITQY